MIYTVILNYNDWDGSTYMTSLEAGDPEAAAQAAFDELSPHEAAQATVIAVIEGEHNDVYPHNQ